MRKLKLILEYRGLQFAGWQKQATGTSVQETLETALFHLTGERISIRAAGRTDAGVHALGQVVSFQTQSQLPLRTFVNGGNAYLPHEVTILHAEDVPDSFDARHSASGKLYRYQIWNAAVRSTFRAQTFYHIRNSLCLDTMRQAAQYLCGQHDFRAFRAADCERKTTIRSLKRVDILDFAHDHGLEIHLEVEGTAFLKNMVRIIAGTLIQVGLGKMEPTQIPWLLQSGDRTQAGPTAPSHGLFLCRVDYRERLGI